MKLAISIFPIALALSSLCGCQSANDSTSSDVMTSNEVVKAPSDLKAEPLDGGAHLTWKDNSDNEAEFMIERKMIGEDWTTVGTVPANSTSHHDPSLMTDATYKYRVMAMPKSGEHGSYSNEATCKGPSAGAAGTAASAPHGSGGAGTGGAATSGPHGAGGSGAHGQEAAGSASAAAGSPARTTTAAGTAAAGGAGSDAAGGGAGGSGSSTAGAGAAGSSAAGAGGGGGHEAHHTGASGSAGGP